MKKHNHRLAKEAGNILFLILLAVILFAALSYAVTQSLRGGGKDASSENATVAAAGMIQFMTDIETFITRARLIDNVKDDEFSFRVDPNSTSSNANYMLQVAGTVNGYIMNIGGCTRTACQVFKPYNPSGIAAQRFEQYADPAHLASATGSGSKGGHLDVRQLAIQNIGTSAPDVVGLIDGLKPDVCNEINRQIGLTTNYDTSISIGSIETSATSRPLGLSPTWLGATVLNTTNVFGDEATQFAGRRSFCAPLNNSGNGAGSRLTFLHVLIER